MGENSEIGWTDDTFNPWIGCTEVSTECAHCYAKTLAERYGWAKWGDKQPRYRTSTANWKKPIAWNNKAAKEGVRRRVFCASLADILDSEVPHEWRTDLFSLIESTPNLDWLLLTKRTESFVLMLPSEWLKNPLPNVWLGATVGHPKSKWRIGGLREVPAVVHFLSCEPLLDDLGILDLSGIEWVIAGGESGPRHRRLNIDHARSLRDQCVNAGVPYFFKQHGGNRPESNGCLLDGREWKEFPGAN